MCLGSNPQEVDQSFLVDSVGGAKQVMKNMYNKFESILSIQ